MQPSLLRKILVIKIGFRRWVYGALTYYVAYFISERPESKIV
jgi:hypothetical protein